MPPDTRSGQIQSWPFLLSVVLTAWHHLFRCVKGQFRLPLRTIHTTALTAVSTTSGCHHFSSSLVPGGERVSRCWSTEIGRGIVQLGAFKWRYNQSQWRCLPGGMPWLVQQVLFSQMPWSIRSICKSLAIIIFRYRSETSVCLE